MFLQFAVRQKRVAVGGGLGSVLQKLSLISAVIGRFLGVKTI